MKKLIATDYDGTLRINGKISDYDRECIKKFRAAGNYFGIVTGRGSDFFNTVKEEKLEVDFIIVYTGALITDSDGNTVFESPMQTKTFNELTGFFKNRSDVEWYDSCEENETVYQYYATCKNQETALNVAGEVKKVFGDITEVFVNGPHINICNRGISKESGIREVLKYFSLTEASAAPVGDDYNDLQMITGLNGWAVESGRAEVVKKAPHICKSVGDLANILLSE